MAKTLQGSRLSHRLFLAVKLGRELYGIPFASIDEVWPSLPIEPVPEGPDFLCGVVVARGCLIPVVDAAARLKLTNHQSPPEPHIVCLRVRDRLIGLRIDEALDIVEISPAAGLNSAELGADRSFVSEITDCDGQTIRLLDPDRLLEDLKSSDLVMVSKAMRDEPIE